VKLLRFLPNRSGIKELVTDERRRKWSAGINGKKRKRGGPDLWRKKLSTSVTMNRKK